jgi:hypothetical protein
MAGAEDFLDPAPGAAVVRSDRDLCVVLAQAAGMEASFLSQGDTSGGLWTRPVDPRMPTSDAQALKNRYIEDGAIVNAKIDRETLGDTPGIAGDPERAGRLQLLDRVPRLP